MSQQVRPRDERGRILPHRIGADGKVLCRDCGERKWAHQFPTVNRSKTPDSYCFRCRAERSARYQRWRVRNDPDWYEGHLKRGVVNAKRLRRRQGRERLELVQLAIAWMKSRGFWQQEIARLADCPPETVHRWMTGKCGVMGYPSVGERLIALHLAASDIPPWPNRNRQRDKTHPWFAVVEARLREAHGTF